MKFRCFTQWMRIQRPILFDFYTQPSLDTIKKTRKLFSCQPFTHFFLYSCHSCYDWKAVHEWVLNKSSQIKGLECWISVKVVYRSRNEHRSRMMKLSDWLIKIQSYLYKKHKLFISKKLVQRGSFYCHRTKKLLNT